MNQTNINDNLFQLQLLPSFVYNVISFDETGGILFGGNQIKNNCNWWLLNRLIEVWINNKGRIYNENGMYILRYSPFWEYIIMNRHSIWESMNYGRNGIICLLVLVGCSGINKVFFIWKIQMIDWFFKILHNEKILFCFFYSSFDIIYLFIQLNFITLYLRS